MKSRGIIVLEGADASGKTTLARHLVEKHGARYLHNRVWPDMWRYHVASARLALRWADTGLVVIDRLWLSELVYGQVFRGGAFYDPVGARAIDRLMQRAGAINVLCVPTSQHHQLIRHGERAAIGGEKFNNIREVVALFADLRHGNVARPGDGYLGQLTRFGDFADRRDVVIYDMDLDGHHLNVFARHLLLRLALYRNSQVPGGLQSDRPNLLGHAGTARVLFVAESLGNPVAATPWPLFASGINMNSSVYLSQALHAIGFDETTACWTNALSSDQHLEMLAASPAGRCVIALGRTAEARCINIGIRPNAVLPHPQWWRRFRFAEQKVYSNLLRDAINGTDERGVVGSSY